MSDQLNNEGTGLRTVIIEKTRISGDIIGSDELVFSGELTGSVKLGSFLYLKRGGKIDGTVEADNIVIEGELTGNVVVNKKIEIRAHGVFNGNIVCKQIAIEEGAFFQGEVKMVDGQEVKPIYFKEKRKELKNKPKEGS